MVETLIKSGAFDNLGVYRSKLLNSYERLIDMLTEKNRNNIIGQLDMFSIITSDNNSHANDLSFTYPDIPEYSLKELLALEKDSSGMYFSGQMLDEYAEHVQYLAPDSIADYVSDDSDPADKARASFAGIVTSVTLKNTRSGDRMAFFTIEDRMAEMECVAFAKQYAESAHLIHTDSAVYVSGTISLREDEPPKLLVNRMEPLIENQRFERPQESEKKTMKTPVEPAPARAENPQRSPQAHQKPKVAQGTHTRLFLRVPDATGSVFCKALNLVELFDGDFPAYFYFADEKRYDVTPHGISMSDYVLEQLCRLLGEDNVILK